MVDAKIVDLVSISAYALAQKISRPTVYKLIEEGRLTKYLDKMTGETKLDINERPSGVQRYAGIRERKKR